MSTFKSKSYVNYGQSVDGSYSFIQEKNLCKCNSSTLDLSPDSKWWLNNRGLEKHYSYEQLNMLESDVELLSATYLSGDKKLSEDPEGYCTVEPWWHSPDKDDVKSVVSQRSSSKIKNSDLKESHNLRFENVSIDSSTQDNLGLLKRASQRNFASIRKDASQGKPGLTECIINGSDVMFTSNNDSSNSPESRTGNLSRTELLEALCHSQTRAREAEKLAQEAYDEKDQVIDLFFRQASYLLAYRQWLKILQLETLCLHLGTKSYPTSYTSQAILPWSPYKNVTLRKNLRKVTPKKTGKKRFKLSKYVVAFAVGLSLAGAGLLVGWTVGWLFPVF